MKSARWGKEKKPRVKKKGQELLSVPQQSFRRTQEVDRKNVWRGLNKYIRARKRRDRDIGEQHPERLKDRTSGGKPSRCCDLSYVPSARHTDLRERRPVAKEKLRKRADSRRFRKRSGLRGGGEGNDWHHSPI